ncbi:M56 family metallopeptidase [Colwellia sp. 1_MG-2023]|uniref:M56 family metallopeptidase n=1 Tax=Colwellia sp. 1_MG-2023 TaxID=3062649 RepID=UPI0026E14A9C|nr:M56 family metallopeptidase [Colwellia sp. 1_MG-2023]MDO6446312.1 M56 family metallopeptidase [Colwellia sp. 1_MG-2023]
MIDLLISWLAPLTIILSIILLSHRLLLRKLGPKKVYFLWIYVPLGLSLYSLPITWFHNSQFADAKIQQFIVLPTQTLQQQFTVEWLIACWVLISSLMIVYWLVSHLQFLRKTTFVKFDADTLPIKLPEKLSVFQSAHTYSPMIVGVFNQKLLLPEEFTALYNEEQQTLILEHEICHFDRNDIYWNLIAFVLLALFWFQPLVWLAYFRFRRDQELSCDQIVLARKQSASRINYSRALLVAAETTPPLAFAQLSFKKYGDKEIMFERIKHIKTHTQASKVSLALASVLSVTLLSGLSYAGNIGDGNSTQKHRTPPAVKKEAMPTYRVEPKYPLKAVEEEIEGAVVLKFDINGEGEVKNVEVMDGVPAYVFDRVAITALKQWKYDATGDYHKNQLVQLDFRMSPESTFKDVNLIEKIKVTQ